MPCPSGARFACSCKELELYANIRPVKIFDALKHSSPLKAERIAGGFRGARLVGLLWRKLAFEDKSARDINDYSYEEVERITRRFDSVVAESA